MRYLRDFLKTESASGIVLFMAALAALLVSNSPWALLYQKILITPIEINLFHFQIAHPFLFWINDGLMAIFFLLIGLELKREFLEGELSDISRVILPGIAAFGGMLVPALIYLFLNAHDPIALRGWAIPVATDIAFALGMLSLFGKRIPLGLRLFLMALAIFDDVGAIIIIAVFHTADLSYVSLFLALLAILFLWLLNKLRVQSLAFYLGVGFLLWICVLKSGVHATVSGVVLAIMIPLHKSQHATSSLLHQLEKALHPWVAYLVMPLFAFANAGLSLSDISMQTAMDSISLGIILGLFLGKQIGVFGFAWSTIQLGWATLPSKTNWSMLYGVAILCGIGFTMSLFLGTLAFAEYSPLYLVKVRFGVLTGSLLAGIVGAFILHHSISNELM